MQERKQQVIQVAVQLFSEKGFYDTSIQDIINQADISKGTFYNYFASKNDCLIAILEQSRDAAMTKRQELAYKRDIKDEALLIDQIVAVIQLNNEENLMPIFQSIFQSNDQSLHKILLQYRFAEMNWLAERLMDVYGDDIRPYAAELSIVFFAILHHLALAYRTVYKHWVNPKENVETAYRYTIALMEKIKEDKEPLIYMEDFKQVIRVDSEKKVSSSIIINKLEKLLGQLEETNMPDEMDLATCLLEEFRQEKIRVAIIGAIIPSFQKKFIQTKYEVLSRELTTLIWNYLSNNGEKAHKN